MSSDEIAFLLGYQEINSFLRAFNVWTGMSITEFRASITRCKITCTKEGMQNRSEPGALRLHAAYQGIGHSARRQCAPNCAKNFEDCNNIDQNEEK